MSAPSVAGSRAGDPSVPSRLYVILLVALVAVFLPRGLQDAVQKPGETLLWIALITASHFRNIPLLPRVGLETTVAAPFSVAASVLLPLPLAVLVKFVGATNEREFQRETPRWNIAFNRAQTALSTGAAAFAALQIEHVNLTSATSQIKIADLSGVIVAILFAGIVYYLVNNAAVTVYLCLLGRLGMSQAAKASVIPSPYFFALDIAMVTGLALLIVMLYAQVGPYSVLFLALPLWVGYSALRSARENEDRAEELSARVRQLEMLNALGTDLLSARRREQVEVVGTEALRTALDSWAIRVSLEDDVPDHLQVVKVPGAGGATIGVPSETSERSMEVVEAAARMLGMSLQRLELEEELGEVERARANLSGKIIEEGTRERSRIALKIHDEVLPYLAAAEIQADNVRSAITSADPARAEQLAAATREAVNGGINRLRQVLDALTSQIVVPGGLRQALLRSLDQLRLEHGVDGRLEAPDPLPELPLTVEILVLEVVSGCLANVAKHAQARNVVVELDVTDTLITVRVCDDGRGFDPVHVPEGRHGLALMQQRVELARGRLTVRSAVTGGTRVQVEVPL